MAARKKTRRGVGSALVPVTTGGDMSLPDDIFEELRKDVEREEATTEGGIEGPFISLNKQRFTLESEQLGEPLYAVVLGQIHENQLYKTEYDPESPTAPDCYALAIRENEMAPPVELATRECDRCQDCWANAWGSAEGGRRGKACGQKIRLVLLPWEDDPVKLEDAAMVRMRVPTVSMKGWNTYANKIHKALKRTLFSVVTEFTLEDHPSAQFVLAATLGGAFRDPEVVLMLQRRAHEAQALLEQVPQPQAVEEGVTHPSGAKRKPARRKVAKKKTAEKKKKVTKKKTAAKKKKPTAPGKGLF